MGEVMFSKQEWVSGLRGLLEIFLFMKQGTTRFDTSFSAAIRSLIFPAIFLPLSLIIIASMAKPEDFYQALFIHLIEILMAAMLFFGVVYGFSKQYERSDKFWHFVNVSNWANINGMIFIMPILIGILLGIEPRAFENYAIFVTIMAHVYNAFILTHVFRVPWEMGGFIAIVGLAITNEGMVAAEYLTANV